MAKKRSKTFRNILFRGLLISASLFCIFSGFAQEMSSSLDPDSVSVKLKKQITKPLGRLVPSFRIVQRTTNNTITASIGSANMYDTYLSPLQYKGFSVKLMYEQLRRTTWFDYNFYKQQIFDLEFAKGDSPAKNVTEYWFLANYRIGGHYMFYRGESLRIGAGGLWDVNAGVLYNERNGNNPATARGYTNLNLSATASYKLPWFAVRWQVDTPVLGALFSPRYGQSYYEISLGNTVDVVNFASLHNQRALRNYITVDIPIKKYTIRVGYLGSWYQTKVHNIQTHHYTNSFVIGFPIEGVKVPRQKAENRYWDTY